MRALSMVALLMGAMTGMSASRAGEPAALIGPAGSAMQVDGRIDAAEWAGIEPRPLAFEISPRYAEPTTWESMLRISHDGRHLLLAIEARDPRPDHIVASRGARDTLGSNEDHVAVMIDAEGTRQRHFEFRVNAAGTLDDLIMGGTGAGSPQWSGNWQAAVQRTDRGYDVEIAIPLTTLNVSADASQQLDLAINVTREIGRDRRETLALLPLDTRQICQECQYRTITLAGLPADRQWLQVRPYVAAGRFTRLAPDGGSDRDSRADPGVDVLWNLGGGRKLVGTLNPDFSEVAPDQIQFSINQRNVVTFTENRTFFSENAGVFGINLPLVYTRSISDPSAALAYSAASERMTVAALVARDRANSFILPGQHGSRVVTLDGGSETFLGRLQHNGAEGRRAGMLLTARHADGYNFQLVALDGRTTIGERQSVEAAIAISRARVDDDIAAAANLPEDSTGGILRVSHNYKARRLSVFTFLNRSTPDLRVDTGNQNRIGTTFVHHEWMWTLPRPPGGRISSISGGIWGEYADLLHSGDQDNGARAFGFVNFSDGSSADAYIEGTFETYRGHEFNLLNVGGGYGWQINDFVRVNAGVSATEAIDLVALEKATGLRAFSGFSVKVGGTFTLNGNFNIDSLHGETQRNFVTRSALLRVNWSPRARHTLSLVGNWGATRQRNKLTGVPAPSSDRLRGQVVYLYQRPDRSSFHVGVNLGGSGTGGIESVRRTDELLFGKLVLNLDWGT